LVEEGWTSQTRSALCRSVFNFLELLNLKRLHYREETRSTLLSTSKMSTPNNEVYDRTPLAYSKVLSRKLGANVFLKLDNLQPSGSFKNRGVGYFCSRLHQRNPSAAVVIASGGNAALACSASPSIDSKGPD
jgi:threonine dehydratase